MYHILDLLLVVLFFSLFNLLLSVSRAALLNLKKLAVDPFFMFELLH
jgi:hypothetical protein